MKLMGDSQSASNHLENQCNRDLVAQAVQKWRLKEVSSATVDSAKKWHYGTYFSESTFKNLQIERNRGALAQVSMGKLNSGHFMFCGTAFFRSDEILKKIYIGPLERSLNFQMRPRISIRGCVRPLVHPLVCPSVHMYVMLT